MTQSTNPTTAPASLNQGGGDQGTMIADIAGIAAIDESEAGQVFRSCHHDDWDVHGTTEVTVRVEGLPAGESHTAYQALVAEGHYGCDQRLPVATPTEWIILNNDKTARIYRPW